MVISYFQPLWLTNLTCPLWSILHPQWVKMAFSPPRWVKMQISPTQWVKTQRVILLVWHVNTYTESYTQNTCLFLNYITVVTIVPLMISLAVISRTTGQLSCRPGNTRSVKVCGSIEAFFARFSCTAQPFQPDNVARRVLWVFFKSGAFLARSQSAYLYLLWFGWSALRFCGFCKISLCLNWPKLAKTRSALWT